MGEAYRGLTIRIGADTSSLQKSMRGLDKTARQLQSSFRAASKALRVDGGNVALQRAQLRNLGQQAETSAARLARLAQAERQASSQSKALANGTRNAALQEQRLHNSLKSTEAQLASFYDAWARVKTGFSDGKEYNAALNHIRNLSHAAKSGGDAYRQFANAVRSAVMTTGFDDVFNLGTGMTAANKYVTVMRNLNAEWHRLSAAEESMKGAANIQRTRGQIELLKAEVREAAMEQTRFEASTRQMGRGQFRRAANEVNVLDAAIKSLEADTAMLDKALRVDPGNIEAARAKWDATVRTVTMLDQKVAELQTRTKMAGSEEIAKVEKRYGSTARAVETVTRNLANARGRAASIAEKLELARENLQAMRVVGNADGIRRWEAEVQRLSARCESARKDVRNLERTFDTVNRSHAAREAGVELEYMRAKANSAREALGGVVTNGRKLGQIGASIKTLGYSLSATVGSGAMMLGMYAIQASKDVDSAYRDMRKTVNGTEEEFEHLRQAALEFSTTHFTSSDQILSIEAIGGQLGIQAQNLEKFGEVVSNLDIATNVDTETMAQNLGQLSNIMNDMDQDLQTGPGSFEAYSDALVRLGNNSAAQEDKIQNVMMRIASMGTISGMSTPDLLALSTAVAATGQGAEAAGTAISKTFSNIEGAVNGGDAALEKIRNSSGLTEDEIEELTQAVEDGKASLRDFAEVAGMAPEEFKEAWNTDPTRAFNAFIGGLKRIDADGGSVDSTLKSLGINAVRQKQTLNGLVQTFDVLNDSLLMSNNAWNGIGDVWGDAGDAAREAQRKAEGFSGQWQQMLNSAKYLGVELTDSLTPAIAFAADSLGALADGFNGLPDAVKLAISGLGLLTAATGPMSIFVGGSLDGLETIKTALFGNSEAWAKVVREQKKGNKELLALTTASSAVSGRFDKMGGKVFDAGQKMVKANGGASKLGNAISKLGLGIASLTPGKILGVGAAIAGVSVVAGLAYDAYSKWAEHCKMVETAHQTMAERISSAMASAAGSINSSLGNIHVNTVDVLAEYDEYLQKCAQSHEQLENAASQMFVNNGTIEHYADKIGGLLDKLGAGAKLTDSEYAELKSSVKGYNEATGQSIEVTRDESGAVRVLKDNLDVTAESFRKLAEEKRRANEASYYDSEYQNQVKEYEEGGINLAKQKAALQEEVNSYQQASEMLRRTDLSAEETAAWTAALESSKQKIGELLPNIEQLRQDQDRLALSMQVSGQMSTLMGKSLDEMSDFERLVASNSNLRNAMAISKMGVYDFSEAVKTAGVDISLLTSDVDGLQRFFLSSDGSTKSLIDHLGTLGVTLDETHQKALILRGLKIGDKTFTVSDNGTISYGEQQLNELNQFELNGQTYTVEIDTANATASIKDAEGNVVDFSDSVSDIPEEAEVTVTANTEQAKADIQAILDGDYSITVKVNTSGGPTLPTATGGMLPSARMIRHAKGGYFVDRPTVIGRTGNVTHIAGEAGREYVSMNAKGGVVLPLTNPYMRPWVRAVADQMGGSVSTTVNITLAYGADAGAKQMVYDIGREMRLQGLMRG